MRVDVFIVEQDCAYPDLDDHDTASGTRHCWIAQDGVVVGCLRMLEEPGGGTRVGRVATARAVRGRGMARRLMAHVLSVAERPVVLSAQNHLAGWYEGFGFRPCGPVFDEDGIPHVPMRLDFQPTDSAPDHRESVGAPDFHPTDSAPDHRESVGAPDFQLD